MPPTRFEIKLFELLVFEINDFSEPIFQAYISEVRQRKWQEMKHKSENLRETAKMAADRAKAHTTLSAASVESTSPTKS